MTEKSSQPRNTGRSLVSVLTGFLTIVVLSVGTDFVMRAAGIFPNGPMSDALFALATAYRTVYAISGAYLTARLAPSRPISHAIALGIVGVVFGAIGAITTWNAGPELGPHWYPLALVAISLPASWLGGKISPKQG